MKDCKQCLNFSVCKYVEEQRKVASTNMMYTAFEYLEQNNILDAFCKSVASKCKHYVTDNDGEGIRAKLKNVISHFGCLKGYLNAVTPNNVDFYKQKTGEIIDNYIKELSK